MTTPTGPIVGTASVAITPSTATFTPQLQAALQRAMTAVSNAADEMGDDIAREITRGVAEARLALAALTAGLNERFNVTIDRVSSVNKSLLGMGFTATKVGVAFGGLGLAIGGAAGALGGLLGIASQVSGILIGLPAVIGSAALVMGTFKIATEGVGKAMGAALSGDAEAFSKAMEKLSPSAQAAANTIKMLQPQIDKLKKSVQENFFAQLSKSFGDFAIQATQVASGGLPRIATALGNIGNEFFTTATKGGTFFSGLQALIDQTVSGLDRWKGVMPQVANALGNLFQVGSGFAGDLIAGVGQLIGQFATWINVASQTGELQAKFQSALDVFAQFGRIIGNVAHAFGAFWFASQEAGSDFLGTLEMLTQKFATFVNSDTGNAAIVSLMVAASTATSIFGDAVGQLLPIVGTFATVMAQAVTGGLQEIAPALRTAIDAFGGFAAALSGPLGNAIGMIASALSQVLTAVSPLLPVIGQLVGILAEHFAAVISMLAPLIVTFLDALQPMLPMIRDLVATVLSAFIDALGAVLTAIQPLIPVLVQLAVKVLTLLANHFVKIFDAIEPLIPVIVDLVEQGFGILADILPIVVDVLKSVLPLIMDLAKQIGGALAPVLPAIADAFKEIFTQLRPVLPQLAELAGDILVTLAQLFTALVKAIAPMLPPLIQIGTEILAVLMPAFNDLLQAIIPLLPIISELAVKILREALLPIIQALLPVLPILVDALIQLLPAFVDLLVPIADLIVTLTPIIVLLIQVASTIVEVVLPVVVLFITVVNELRAIALTLLGAAIDALVVIIKVGWDAIATAIQVAWLIIKGVFDIIISLLQGDFSEAWRRLETLIKDVWNRLKTFISETIGTIVDYLVEWGPKLYTAGKNAVQRVADAFGEIFGGIFASFGNWIVDIVKGMDGIRSAIFLFFSQAGSWLWSRGVDFIQGFINGMAEKAKALAGWIDDNIISPIKNVVDKGLSIFSPSRWMRDRGVLMVKGLQVGLEDSKNLAVSAAVNLVEATKKPVNDAAENGFPNLSTAFRNTSSTGGVSALTGGNSSGSIVFGPGSVVVSFEGVNPSEADAFRTGQAVAQGISDGLARRDAQLAVRVM